MRAHARARVRGGTPTTPPRCLPSPLGAPPPPPPPQEFQPWIKWLIFDALLTLLLGALVRRCEALRPVFEAVGWL